MIARKHIVERFKMAGCNWQTLPLVIKSRYERRFAVKWSSFYLLVQRFAAYCLWTAGARRNSCVTWCEVDVNTINMNYSYDLKTANLRLTKHASALAVTTGSSDHQIFNATCAKNAPLYRCWGHCRVAVIDRHWISWGWSQLMVYHDFK